MSSTDTSNNNTAAATTSETTTISETATTTETTIDQTITDKTTTTEKPTTTNTDTNTSDMDVTPNITAVLWFRTSHLALSAAQFYTSIFPSSHITHTQYFTAAGRSIHRQTPGDVMLITYTLFSDGNHPTQPPMHLANLNGCTTEGMDFKPAVSFRIEYEDREEVGRYLGLLGEGAEEGEEESEPVGGGGRGGGWVTDRFGVRWWVGTGEMKGTLEGGGNGEGVKVRDGEEKEKGE